MRIKSNGVDDIVFVPESRAEAELMQLWDWGRKAEMRLTDSNNWGCISLTFYFDSKKGRKRRDKCHKELGIHMPPMNP